jgi:hypothetical protein
MSAPSRPRGDESVCGVGQLEAARAVAKTALDELLMLAFVRDYPGEYLLRDWALRDVLTRLSLSAPEQTYVAIQATREALP